MDQLICASLSHPHYWYEVGMLKVPALCDASYVPGLRFNFFSFHKAQQTPVTILDAVRAHIVGKNLTFSCEKSISYLRASRRTPGTVGAKARTNQALASQISTPLSSCVPPCSQSVPNVPNSSRFSSASNVSGTDAAYDDLLELIPPLSPLSYQVCVWEIEFGRKPLFESDRSLAAAALNLDMLKHGKVVGINHLHVSLAHAHASVLQATVRQHSFRMTEKLVSCSACSMTKGKRAPTAHHTTARARRSMELVHIDTAGPSRQLSGDRDTPFFSWTAPLTSSAPTAHGTRLRLPSSPS